MYWPKTPLLRKVFSNPQQWEIYGFGVGQVRPIWPLFIGAALLKRAPLLSQGAHWLYVLRSRVLPWGVYCIGFRVACNIRHIYSYIYVYIIYILKYTKYTVYIHDYIYRIYFAHNEFAMIAYFHVVCTCLLFCMCVFLT